MWVSLMVDAMRTTCCIELTSVASGDMAVTASYFHLFVTHVDRFHIQYISLNITCSFARDLVIISESSIKPLLE